MKYFLIAAHIVVLWCTAVGTANAHHAEPRPFPVPRTLSEVFYAQDFSGVGGALPFGGTDIIGWSFDGNDPDHEWIQSSPTVQWTNTLIGNQRFFVFNGSTFKLSGVKIDNPNGALIFAKDNSTVQVTDSTIMNLTAEHQSTTTLTHTKVAGGLIMQSAGTMTLDDVIHVDVSGLPPGGRLTAQSGTTVVTGASILTSLNASGSANVTMTGSSVLLSLSCSRLAGTANNPSITLEFSSAPELNAEVGTINMTGGVVFGGVSATGSSTISVTGSTVDGSATVGDSATLNLTNASITNIDASGDDSHSTANVTGGSVRGVVQARGNATVNLNNVQTIGDGLGAALIASDHSTVNATGIAIIVGSVTLHDDSTINMSSVSEIAGGVSVSGRVTLELTGTNIFGAINGAGERGILRMTGGQVSGNAVSFGGGTIDLRSVLVNGSMKAFDTSHLNFYDGSHANQDLTAFDNTNVAVRGGLIDGNLIGLGSSITAMSGGRVLGSPVFLENAAFLYSGGTFGFGIGLGGGDGASRLQTLDSSGGVGGGDPAQGFTARDSSQIHFIGFGLTSTLVDPNFEGNFSVYELSGRLADGTQITGGLVYVQNGTGASFQLIEAPVPEPAAGALLLAGMITLGAMLQARQWRT